LRWLLLSDRQVIANSLRETMESDPQFIAVTLDCLTNLNLDEESLSSITKTVLSLLSSADAKDLPLIIRFLLVSSVSPNAETVCLLFPFKLLLSH